MPYLVFGVAGPIFANAGIPVFGAAMIVHSVLVMNVDVFDDDNGQTRGCSQSHWRAVADSCGVEPQGLVTGVHLTVEDNTGRVWF
jgi:hypothetical protein